MGSIGSKKTAGRASDGRDWKVIARNPRRDTRNAETLEAYSKYAYRNGPENMRIGAKTVMTRGMIKSNHVE